MNIIIPMAGLGKRMRPQTLTVQKPLIKIAGKSIVERLIEQIHSSVSGKIDNIGFVIMKRDEKVEIELSNISVKYNAKARFYVQERALGTAHAINCASELLSGNTIVAFADTLFDAKFIIDDDDEGIVWVKQVDDPSMFGVINTDRFNVITDFIEKPKEKIFDRAIIGIYYFKEGKQLRQEIEYLIDNKIQVKGEFQLTDALENFKNSGVKLKAKEVRDWMDCGNKDATVETNKKILLIDKRQEKRVYTCNNSTIIEPVYIGKSVKITNSVIGPYVSIEDDTVITNSIITNSIIQSNAILEGLYIDNSMFGNNVEIKKFPGEFNVGDYSKINN